jgi:hypothetical protein
MPNRAASQIWPHLPTQKVEPPRRQPTSALSESMYPTLTPRARDQERRRQQTIANIRELAQSIRSGR